MNTTSTKRCGDDGSSVTRLASTRSTIVLVGSTSVVRCADVASTSTMTPAADRSGVRRVGVGWRTALCGPTGGIGRGACGDVPITANTSRGHSGNRHPLNHRVPIHRRSQRDPQSYTPPNCHVRRACWSRQQLPLRRRLPPPSWTGSLQPSPTRVSGPVEHPEITVFVTIAGGIFTYHRTCNWRRRFPRLLPPVVPPSVFVPAGTP